MKIKTDYVQSNNLWYLTEGKVYDVLFHDGSYAEVVDDTGDKIHLCITECPHLDWRAWEVVK